MRTLARLSQMMVFISPCCYFCRLGKAALPSTWRQGCGHLCTRRPEFGVFSKSLFHKSVEGMRLGIDNKLAEPDHL